MFPGKPVDADHADQTFPNVRHVLVDDLTEDELDQCGVRVRGWRSWPMLRTPAWQDCSVTRSISGSPRTCSTMAATIPPLRLCALGRSCSISTGSAA
jgi:hypothetical protein